MVVHAQPARRWRPPKGSSPCMLESCVIFAVFSASSDCDITFSRNVDTGVVQPGLSRAGFLRVGRALTEGLASDRLLCTVFDLSTGNDTSALLPSTDVMVLHEFTEALAYFSSLPYPLPDDHLPSYIRSTVYKYLIRLTPSINSEHASLLRCWHALTLHSTGIARLLRRFQSGSSRTSLIHSSCTDCECEHCELKGPQQSTGFNLSQAQRLMVRLSLLPDFITVNDVSSSFRLTSFAPNDDCSTHSMTATHCDGSLTLEVGMLTFLSRITLALSRSSVATAHARAQNCSAMQYAVRTMLSKLAAAHAAIVGVGMDCPSSSLYTVHCPLQSRLQKPESESALTKPALTKPACVKTLKSTPSQRISLTMRVRVAEVSILSTECTASIGHRSVTLHIIPRVKGNNIMSLKVSPL